jgi:riboflavin synthase
MFTGLIEEVGQVIQIEPRGGTYRIAISSPKLGPQLKTGDSIAVSGVCLTALDITSDSFAADLAEETVARTSLTALNAGSLVNLELPAKAGAPLGGHVVQGHVDAAGRVLSLHPAQEEGNGSRDWWLEVEVPKQLEKYIVEKGSVAIEGISLTVAGFEHGKLAIAIIPHTYQATNLSAMKPGDLVNIEIDVLARYAEKMAAQKAGSAGLTLEELVRKGF